MTTPQNLSDDPSKAAAHWLVALEETPDDAQLRARFTRWLAADPAHGAAWRGVKDTNALLGLLGASKELDAADTLTTEASHPATRTDERPIGSRDRARRRWAWGAIPALVAASIALALFAPSLALRLQADYVTARGEMTTLALKDGSTVTLGAQSALKIGSDDTQRQVTLLAGEAIFEITRDPERPFVVLAGDATTTVLGTKFMVRRSGEITSVAVETGLVAVQSSLERSRTATELSPGDWIRVSGRVAPERGTGVPEAASAMAQGRILARDRRFDSVLADVRRHFNGSILVTNRALMSKRLTGVYLAADPVSALRAMAAAHGADIRQISPWLLVVSGG